ncbi:MAG: serine hydrolase [Myxococcales bacterium]|nr:serine hydrolase [Myxococcales bacterium]
MYKKKRRARRVRRVRRNRRYARRSRRSRPRRWKRRYTRRSRSSRTPLPYPPGGQRTAFCSRLLRREEALRYVQGKHSLQSSLRRYIGHLRSCGWLRPHDYARVMVYDHRGCKMAGIQERNVTSAASLIKPFVMFAAYEKAYRQGLPPHRFPLSLQNQINRMMRVSSNSATNHMIRYVGDGDARRGLARINQLIRKHGMKSTRLVELIPRNGRTYRNTTTARDLNILLAKIYRRRAVSSAYSRLMMRVMLHSRDNRGRTPYLRSHYHVTAATKTGYTRRTNGVAGIILAGKGLGRAAYNLVAVVTRPSGAANEWIWKRVSSPIVRRISEMTYHYYATGAAQREIRRSKKRRTRIACAQ